MSNSLQGTLQAAIRSALGCANSFEGDLHALCDIYGVSDGHISGRLIPVAKVHDATIGTASGALNYLLQNPTALPSFGLNFVDGTNVLDPRITFTRPSGAGRINASKQFEWVGDHQPRFDYDPVTGAARGLLVEEQRTNKCQTAKINPTGGTISVTKSGDLASTLTLVDDTAALASAGLGVINSNGIVYKLDNSLGTLNAYAEITGPTGNTNVHTGSAYIRGTGDARIRSRASAGTTYTLTSGYARATNTFTPAGSVDRLWINAVAGAVVYFIIPQLEEGSFATSPIVDATTSQITRAADVAVVSNLAPWFNANEGTLLVEFLRASEPSGISWAAAFRLASTVYNRIGALFSTSGGGGVRGFIADNNVTQTDLYTSAYSRSAINRVAFAYKANDSAISTNGGAAVVDTSCTIPAVDQLVIGSIRTSEYLNGHITRVRYYPTVQNTQALTS